MARPAASSGARDRHGRGGGIGLAIAEAFAAAGARVLLADVRDSGRSRGQRASAPPRPSAGWTSPARPSGRSSPATRGDPPDVLVNNAGGLIDSRPLHEATSDTWTRTIELNLTSVFLGMRAVLPLMLGAATRLDRERVLGLRHRPGSRTRPAYQAAKAGALMLRGMPRVTYGPRGIRMNALTPSVVETPGPRP